MKTKVKKFKVITKYYKDLNLYFNHGFNEKYFW